ncbi:unnamed protein product [Linum trigynum]|uniref:Uncharacterized protein n=1 Tax=Linum trigynum TaxID=586398 RepID=A0AAV2D985_9ROSI
MTEEPRPEAIEVNDADPHNLAIGQEMEERANPNPRASENVELPRRNPRGFPIPCSPKLQLDMNMQWRVKGKEMQGAGHAPRDSKSSRKPGVMGRTGDCHEEGKRKP